MTKELERFKKFRDLNKLGTANKASGGAQVGAGEFSAKEIRTSTDGNHGFKSEKIQPSPIKKSMDTPAKDADEEIKEGYEQLEEITKKARGPASTAVLDMTKSKAPLEALKALEPKSVVRESEVAELKKKKAK